MRNRPRIVKVTWDSEARVLVAESDDIPGLITEAENRDTGEALVLLSGLEKMTDGRTASETFMEWFKSLANAGETT